MAYIENNLGNINSGGGSFDQDNIDKFLTFRILDSEGITSETIEQINALGYVIDETESLWIQFYRQEAVDVFGLVKKIDIYKVINTGKGVLVIDENGSNLKYITSYSPNADSYEDLESTDIISITSLGGQTISQYVNTHNPPYVIQSQSEGYTIFQIGTDVNNLISYLYLGEGGTFGQGSGQTTNADFQLLSNVTPNIVYGESLPKDFFISNTYSVANLGKNLTYITDTFRTLDIGNLVNAWTTNAVIVIDENTIFIHGQKDSENGELFGLTLKGCRIINNELTYTSYELTDFDEIFKTTNIPSALHSMEYHRGFVYFVTRPRSPYSVGIQYLKVNPFDLQDKIYGELVDYVGTTTNLVMYEDSMFFLVTSGINSPASLVRVSTDFSQAENIFTYPNTNLQYKVSTNYPFTISNDKVYIATRWQETAGANKLGILKFDLFKGELENQSMIGLEDDPTAGNFPVPHWINVFNDKLLVGTATGPNIATSNKSLSRINCASLELEETMSLPYSITNNNSIHADGTIYINSEYTTGTPAKLYTVKYYDFTTFQGIGVEEYYSLGSPDYIPYKKSFKNKLSHFINDEGFEQSQLQKVTEGDNIGYRLLGYIPTKYTSIGNGSVDLAFVSSESTDNDYGVSSDYSFSFGAENKVRNIFGGGALGSGNIIEGSYYNFTIGAANEVSGFLGNGAIGAFNKVIEGYTSWAIGAYNEIESSIGNGFNFTAGMNNRVSDIATHAIGTALISKTFNTIALGVANTDYTEEGSDRPLLVVGNGTITTPSGAWEAITRSDAFRIRFDGRVEAPSQTIAQINADTTGKILATKEWIQASSPNLSLYQTRSEKGQVNGYASLNSAGKIPNSQIPALAISETFIVANQAAMLALVAEQGDVAIRTDLSKSFILRQEPATTLGNWSELLTPMSPVQSVNGLTGTVVLGKSEIGLGNVDNTSDLSKPISTATQTALNGKANLAGGNSFTGFQMVTGNITAAGQLSSENSAFDNRINIQTNSSIINIQGANFADNSPKPIAFNRFGGIMGIGVIPVSEILEVGGNIKMDISTHGIIQRDRVDGLLKRLVLSGGVSSWETV